MDRPVSNSGRMKSLLIEFAEKYQLNWEVQLENNPDKYIANSPHIAITSDAWILDRVSAWYNLLEELIPANFLSLLIG